MSSNAGARQGGEAAERTAWPRISLVVPNYNGGKTIEATLRSIIEQNYPGLELIVMDGESKDDSVEIIKRYEKHIAYWEERGTGGQSDAINKGFAKCTGEIVNWLCSDDLLEPGALRAVGGVFAGAEGAEVDWCIGKCRLLFPDRPDLNTTMWPEAEDVERTPLRNFIPQPSCFYRRKLLDRVPAVKEEFNYAMDQELWCYFLSKGAKWKRIDTVLSVAVQDGKNKTRSADYRYCMETDRLFRKYWKGGDTSPTPRWFRMSIRPLAIYAEKHPGGAGAGMANWMILKIGMLQRAWRGVRRRH